MEPTWEKIFFLKHLHAVYMNAPKTHHICGHSDIYESESIN